MILVIGDVFLDRYHIGKVRGMSAEAPIPVVDIVDVKEFPGGAGNVYCNILALGEKAHLHIESDNAPIKNRLVVEDHLQLARWDEKDYCNRTNLVTWPSLSEVEGIVVCDYGKGAVTKELVEYISYLCEDGLPTYVDTKANPKDWIEAATGPLTLFPNLSEYTRYKDMYDWFPQVLLKQGKEGLAWMEYGNIVLSRPALASKVVSVNGAGDTVLAAYVVGKKYVLGLPKLLKFCNLAAAVVVEAPYTSVATLSKMEKKYEEI